tara:strand:+ start:1294 stop:2544 length:1251 start_codon:yes stop_codon:yes gene_type:complete
LIKYLIYVAVGFFCTACHFQAEPARTTLAQIGNMTIQSKDFVYFYTDFLRRSGASDNLQFRNQFLESEIDRKVFLVVGDSLEFNTISMVQDKIDLVEKQYVLNEYFHREIFLKYQASDSLLREAFKKSKINIHARHLFAPNIESANQLSALLEQGKTFEELASGIFRDSTLASSGGDLGYFSLGEMDPPFEDAAFALADGEISHPVKTQRGYSIIQVIDRWVEPMISEQDFQLHKNDMNAILRSRKIQNRKQEWTDSLAQTLQIEITEDNLNQLFENKANILQNDFQALLDTKIELKSKLGKWGISELAARLNRLSNAQVKLIDSSQKLRESLRGIVVKEKILQLAQSQKWYDLPELQWNISREKEDVIIFYTIDYYLKDIKPRLKADYTGLLQKLREKVAIQIHAEKVQELDIIS